jgi:hypothetical protein
MKRWLPLQFRLWHLGVAITLWCVCLAWVVALRQRAGRQAAALHSVQMQGGTYDAKAASAWREWLAGGPVDRILTVRFQRRGPGDTWGPYGPKGQSIKLHDWSTESFPQIGRALQELPGITALDFDRTRLRNYTSVLIPKSARITNLSLHETGVRSADLAVLERLPNLTQLSLRRTSTNDDGLRYVAPLDQLEWLDLSSSDVTDEGMVEIARLTNLKTLRLENTHLTDAGLATLSVLRNLEELNLGMTLITEQSIPHLSEMRVSVWIGVPYEWSPAAIESLKRTLPATCFVRQSFHRLSDRPDAKAHALPRPKRDPPR